MRSEIAPNILRERCAAAFRDFAVNDINLPHWWGAAETDRFVTKLSARLSAAQAVAWSDLDTIGQFAPNAKAGYAEDTGGQDLPFVIREVASAIAGKELRERAVTEEAVEKLLAQLISARDGLIEDGREYSWWFGNFDDAIAMISALAGVEPAGERT